MITPAYSITATERVLPKLALDFTTASLDPRVTFTRAGNTATRTNSSGYVESINADLPRFDYNPSTLVCQGLLVEEARTNLALYSEDFRDTAAAGSTRPWTYIRSSVTADSVASPSNQTNADTLVEDSSASTTHYLQQSISKATSAIAYTFTCYVKKGSRDFVQFWISGTSGGSNGVRATFNLATGAVGTSGTIGTGWVLGTPSITPAANGFYRCSLSFTSGTESTLFWWIMPCLSTSLTSVFYTGNGSNSLYIWGAQLEAGAFATSYIPTTTTALTRDADVATMTGTNFSDWFNASEGTFVARSASLTTSSATRSIFDARSATTIRMGLQNFGTFGSFVAVDTTTQASLDGTSTVAANTFFQVAGGYKVNDFGCAANGGAIVTDTSGTVPVANVAWIGGVNGTSVRNGWISNIWYYPQKLTSAQISAFSKQG